MNPKIGTPRYDDTSNIDSNAVARRAPAKNQHSIIEDPDATAYTEMYCAPTNAIDPQPQPGKV